MRCNVLAQPPSSQKASSTLREPQQPPHAILLAIHNRNRRLGKLRRGQPHAGHGAVVRTTPPMTPSSPAIQIWIKWPRSYVDSGQYRSTKLASARFQKRPPIFPYPTRSPSAESKSNFYLFLFQKSDSLIYRITIQNLFSSYLLRFRSDFSAFRVGVILATRRLDL